jgi:hypothetical protein
VPGQSYLSEVLRALCLLKGSTMLPHVLVCALTPLLLLLLLLLLLQD